MAILGSNYSYSVSRSNRSQNNLCDDELETTFKNLVQVLNTCTNSSKIECVEAYKSLNNVKILIEKCESKDLN